MRLMISDQFEQNILTQQSTFYYKKEIALRTYKCVLSWIRKNVHNREWSASGGSSGCRGQSLSYGLKNVCEKEINGFQYVTNTLIKLALAKSGFDIMTNIDGFLREPNLSDISNKDANFIWKLNN